MDVARFGSLHATDVIDIRHGSEALRALDTHGWWAVVATFEGEVTAVRFGTVQRTPLAETTPADPIRRVGWPALDGDWSSSLDKAGYHGAVAEVRQRVADGFVYQANICRVLEYPLGDGADLDGLAAIVAAGNPAPYAGRLRVDAAALDIVCASPESYLARVGRRVVSSPIKGTSRPGEPMLAKDVAENVMIADLVRNDLSAVCEPGSIDTEALCAVEPHPGLDHLVSRIAGRLRQGVTWREIFAATFPPGSVSGAPKSSALRTIADLEAVPRGPYCGAIGWVDADAQSAELAVGIRSFWTRRDPDGVRHLCFGTGAGITWGSDPHLEWQETELKAARLIALASRGRDDRT